MFTDSEIMLMQMHRRNVGGIVADAQAVVDLKNAAIDEAHAEIVRLQRMLAGETAKRLAAELERDDLRTKNSRLVALARSLA